MKRFIQIDEEGYFSSSGLRITDESYGQALLRNLRLDNRAYLTRSENFDVYIEAFDQPLVARGVERGRSGPWTILLPYGASEKFDPKSLAVDDWDRFHGRTVSGLPFVLSRPAQMQLFDLADEFSDDSLTLGGKKFTMKTLNELDKSNPSTPPSLEPNSPARTDVNTADFWSDSYRHWKKSGAAPGWELGEPAKPFKDVIPQIKIPKSRICVLGAGSSHDAAFLASLGHLVTAVDISDEAVEKAKALHPESANLKFVRADAFDFAKSSRGEFDVVLEHTFFCAIDPQRRQELVRAWRTLLADGGHLLGIFFTMDRGSGPPFGASEWELRERLRRDFEFLYWTRWKNSLEARMGKELVIYARKK